MAAGSIKTCSEAVVEHRVAPNSISHFFLPGMDSVLKGLPYGGLYGKRCFVTRNSQDTVTASRHRYKNSSLAPRLTDSVFTCNNYSVNSSLSDCVPSCETPSPTTCAHHLLLTACSPTRAPPFFAAHFPNQSATCPPGLPAHPQADAGLVGDCPITNQSLTIH